MRSQALLSFLSLLLAVSSAQNVTNVLNPDTDAFISKVLADWNSPGGIAVAVVRKDSEGGWRTETKGYGAASLDGRQMTEHTRFSIASNSKLFTVLATGLLIKNETLSPRLSWTSKIASIIPGWNLTDPVASAQATITDAMSHRSGLPRHDLSYRVTDTPFDVVEKMNSLRFSAEFRDVTQYCNLMYSLLSTLPERVLPSKTPFIDYVQEHIFDPLGMNATTYSYFVANSTGEVAEGLLHQGGPLGNGTVRAVPILSSLSNSTVAVGSGGIITNAVDLATWLKTLLLNGVNPETNEVVIPADVVDKAAAGVSIFQSKAQFPELSPVVYGGGQSRFTYRGHELIEHGGNIPGHNSQVTRFPDLGLGVMVYSNDDAFGGSIMEIIKYRLIDEALGLDPIDWNARYKALFSTSAPVPTPRPANATLPVGGLQALGGVFNNAGYGAIELCIVSNPLPTNTSKKCQTLAADAPRILPGAITPGVPALLAEYNSPWGSHLLFSHFNGNLFNASLLSGFPTGNVSEPFWVYPDSEAGVAEFADGGVGLTGLWGAGADAPPLVGQTVKERAEVWFDKA